MVVTQALIDYKVQEEIKKKIGVGKVFKFENWTDVLTPINF